MNAEDNTFTLRYALRVPEGPWLKITFDKYERDVPHQMEATHREEDATTFTLPGQASAALDGLRYNGLIGDEVVVEVTPWEVRAAVTLTASRLTMIIRALWGDAWEAPEDMATQHLTDEQKARHALAEELALTADQLTSDVLGDRLGVHAEAELAFRDREARRDSDDEGRW